MLMGFPLHVKSLNVKMCSQKANISKATYLQAFLRLSPHSFGRI